MSNFQVSEIGSVSKPEAQTFITTDGTVSMKPNGPEIIGTWLPMMEKMAAESKDGKKWGSDKWVLARFVCPPILSNVTGLGPCILSVNAVSTNREKAISILAEPVEVLGQNPDGTAKVRRKPANGIKPMPAGPTFEAQPVPQADVMAAMRAELQAMIAAATKK